MKLTKIFTLAAVVAGSLLAVMALPAQSSTNAPAAGGPPGIRRPNAEQIAKDLGLSDDQKAKVKAVLEEQQKKMQELRANTGLSQEDKRAKMKEMRENFVEKMKEILTPEQFEKWQKAMQQRSRPGGGGGKPPTGDNAPKN
jgi:Spy/CpxP family protein refolding chaperone